MLYLGKDCNVKGLELVGAFGRKCENEDVVFVRDCPELISFMGIMAIEEKKDGGIVYLVCIGKWDECLLKPLEAKLVVGLPIG